MRVGNIKKNDVQGKKKSKPESSKGEEPCRWIVVAMIGPDDVFQDGWGGCNGCEEVLAQREKKRDV